MHVDDRIEHKRLPDQLKEHKYYEAALAVGIRWREHRNPDITKEEVLKEITELINSLFNAETGLQQPGGQITIMKAIDILKNRVGQTAGKSYRQIYDAWSARPTKKGTPERVRAKAALALARAEETPGDEANRQVELEVKFPG